MTSLQYCLKFQQFTPLGNEQIFDSNHGAIQSNSANEDGDENDVGECCSKVHHLCFKNMNAKFAK